MTYSIPSWLALLASLAGISVWSLLVISTMRLAWSYGYNGLKNSLGLFRLVLHQAAIKVWAIAPRIFLVSFAFVTGYAVRDLHQWNRTYILTSVHVLSHPQPDLYMMQTDQGQAFAFKFCLDYVPDLDIGSTLRLLTYEDRQSCKSVAGRKLGYLVKRGSDGHPILAKGN